MNRKILIDGANSEEVRVALVEAGLISELGYDTKGRKQIKGNIYVGFITRIEPSLQAAFVDYGENRQGFVPLDEISPEYYHVNFNGYGECFEPQGGGDTPSRRGDGRAVAGRRQGRAYRGVSIQDVVRVGQKLLLQVIKDERRHKGATLTTYIALTGRACILMPSAASRPNKGLWAASTMNAKRVAALSTMPLPEGASIALKPDIGQMRIEMIRKDCEQLVAMWKSINDDAENIMTSALLYEEGSVVKKMINDYFFDDGACEIIVEGECAYNASVGHIERMLCKPSKQVRLHDKPMPIFSYYDIESQIDELYSNRVALPSGGHIVIDVTEALVAVDVNSGKMTRATTDVESTALKTNVEAVYEIARQFRLRGLSGIIIIDLISMSTFANRRIVEHELKKALINDRAKVNIGRISDFGLVELSRQRIGIGLHELNTVVCKHCNGAGFVRSTHAVMEMFLKRLVNMLVSSGCSTVDVTFSPDMMLYVMNNMAEVLLRIQATHGVQLRYSVSHDLAQESFMLSSNEAASRAITEEEQTEQRVFTAIMNELAARFADGLTA